MGTCWELGEGWARGRVNWCSLLLCTHTLTHAALALFPALQLEFAPGNSWEYIPHLPGEAERDARMQENFKGEEGGSGCSSLVMAVLGVTL